MVWNSWNGSSIRARSTTWTDDPQLDVARGLNEKTALSVNVEDSPVLLAVLLE